ncbi:hypothetical protein AB0J63_17115 [Streptosporangium canum]|uniref:hypothetical protein n=1 Tax=Streptosporangium canum TaxID=324952 RepID=UPI003427481A
MAAQRSAPPVHGDVREQSVLGLVPLGGAGRKIAVWMLLAFDGLGVGLQAESFLPQQIRDDIGYGLFLCEP